METLVARPAHSLPRWRQRLAFAHGARSAFDMSGLSIYYDKVFRPHSGTPMDPAERIAGDMSRVMECFGRSAGCARRALEAGIEIEDLEPGCASNGDSSEAAAVSARRKRGLVLKNLR